MIIIQKHAEFYERGEPAWADDNKKISDFTKAYAITGSFKIKKELKGKTESNGTKNVENLWNAFN